MTDHDRADRSRADSSRAARSRADSSGADSSRADGSRADRGGADRIGTGRKRAGPDTADHEKGILGAYVLGVLDADEHGAVQTHLDDCDACRREVDDLRDLEAALGEIPPEAFLEGPPPDGDLLLRRTLQEVRVESARRSRFTRAAWALAAAAVVVIALAGGVVIGRSDAPPATVVPLAAPRTGKATDAETGATMSVDMRPAAGWVRLHATITGVPDGSQCRLYVVAADGSREPAGSWLAGAGETAVDGSALMAPAEVRAVQAETYAGEILVAVPI